MFKKVVPVTKENHSHLFVKGTDNFLFAKDFHIAPIALKEFFRAAAYYPSIFLEEPGVVFNLLRCLRLPTTTGTALPETQAACSGG